MLYWVTPTLQSVQPRLPPVFTSLISSFLFESTEFSEVSLVLIHYLYHRLSLTHFRNLLESNLGPLAPHSNLQSPVAIHYVLNVSFTSIIDDEGSYAGQALGNFSITS